MMDQKQLFKQMLDFQKSTFDNSFNAMSTLQEQGEKMVSAFLDQATWLPQEGKQLINNWVNAYKEGRDRVREVADTNFKKVETYFSGDE